jgi:RNA polymerase-interacting CarD/CdnL/TRCF family regulator
METKFCTSCQCTREVDGGVFRKTRTSGRWICQPCSQHKTESIYKNKSGQIADVKKIMEKLYRNAALKNMNAISEKNGELL